jgi:hypothetical protein
MSLLANFTQYVMIFGEEQLNKTKLADKAVLWKMKPLNPVQPRTGDMDMPYLDFDSMLSHSTVLAKDMLSTLLNEIPYIKTMVNKEMPDSKRFLLAFSLGMEVLDKEPIPDSPSAIALSTGGGVEMVSLTDPCDYVSRVEEVPPGSSYSKTSAIHTVLRWHPNKLPTRSDFADFYGSYGSRLNGQSIHMQALTPAEFDLHLQHQTVQDGQALVTGEWPALGVMGLQDPELTFIRTSGRTLGLLPCPCIGSTAYPDLKVYDSQLGHQPKHFGTKSVNITETQVKQLMGMMVRSSTPGGLVALKKHLKDMLELPRMVIDLESNQACGPRFEMTQVCSPEGGQEYKNLLLFLGHQESDVVAQPVTTVGSALEAILADFVFKIMQIDMQRELAYQLVESTHFYHHILMCQWEDLMIYLATKKFPMTTDSLNDLCHFPLVFNFLKDEKLKWQMNTCELLKAQKVILNRQGGVRLWDFLSNLSRQGVGGMLNVSAKDVRAKRFLELLISLKRKDMVSPTDLFSMCDLIMAPEVPYSAPQPFIPMDLGQCMDIFTPLLIQLNVELLARAPLPLTAFQLEVHIVGSDGPDGLEVTGTAIPMVHVMQVSFLTASSVVPPNDNLEESYEYHQSRYQVTDFGVYGSMDRIMKCKTISSRLGGAQGIFTALQAFDSSKVRVESESTSMETAKALTTKISQGADITRREPAERSRYTPAEICLQRLWGMYLSLFGDLETAKRVFTDHLSLVIMGNQWAWFLVQGSEAGSEGGELMDQMRLRFDQNIWYL